MANMLYIESPAGVGYSYKQDANYTANDEIARDNNYAAIKDFLEKFRHLSDSEVFVFGQSYGGIYVPMLSVLLQEDPEINFVGLGIGNGMIDYQYIIGSLPYFEYYHGIIGDKKWADMLQECCPHNDQVEFCDFTRCENGKYINESYTYFGIGNPYDVRATCAKMTMENENSGSDSQQSAGEFSTPGPETKTLPLKERAIFMGYPCVNSTATILYMNKPDVRRALHVPDVLPGINDWYMCTDNVDYDVNLQEANMRPNFQQLLKQNIRVLLYYGDLDVICNFLGARWYAESLGQEEEQSYRWWYYKDAYGETQAGGALIEYENLVFMSVKGGSHMVPKETADKAFAMFKRFLANNFTHVNEI